MRAKLPGKHGQELDDLLICFLVLFFDNQCSKVFLPINEIDRFVWFRNKWYQGTCNSCDAYRLCSRRFTLAIKLL